MVLNLTEKLLIKAKKIIPLVIVGVFFVLIIKYTVGIMLPFILGFLIAAIMKYCAGDLMKLTGLSSKSSQIVCLVICYIIFSVLMYFIFRLATVEIVKLFEKIPLIYEDIIYPFFVKISEGLINYKNENKFTELIISFLNGTEAKLTALVVELPIKIAEYTAKIAMNIPEILINIVVTVIASFFICADFENIMLYFKSKIPHKFIESISELKSIFRESVLKLLKCNLIIFLITYSQIFIVLFLFNIKYSFAIAALISVLDLLPLIGTASILVPWGIIELFKGKIALAIGLVVLSLITIIVRNIIEPKIIGKNSGIPAILSLAAMYIGLKLGGVLAAIALPFCLIFLKAFYDNWYNKIK